MVKLGHCSINNLKLSSQSLNAVNEVKYVVEQSNYLVMALGSTPILDLFSERAPPANVMIDIAGYDWIEFSNVLQGAHQITRERIRQIATLQAVYTHGDEGEFWRCVADASL